MTFKCKSALFRSKEKEKHTKYINNNNNKTIGQTDESWKERKKKIGAQAAACVFWLEFSILKLLSSSTSSSFFGHFKTPFRSPFVFLIFVYRRCVRINLPGSFYCLIGDSLFICCFSFYFFLRIFSPANETSQIYCYKILFLYLLF